MQNNELIIDFSDYSPVNEGEIKDKSGNIVGVSGLRESIIQDDDLSDDEESYEDDLYKDANEENSQTSDIPIILISSIAIISLIIVLSKNSAVFNTNKNF